MPLRRLNRREYNNTVRDLLGNTTKPADAFPLDQQEGFIFRRADLVSLLDADVLRTAAESAAAAADVATLAPCSGGATGEEMCARTFITSFGLKAYRRPLLPDELTRLVGVYQAARTTVTLDYAGAIRMVIESMLQSPAFVYRRELGPVAPTMEGNVARLGPYELASRLSYFLWGSMPDKALFDAAAAGKLASDADVEAQARRMVADPKARDTVASFFGEWLNLDQVAERPKDTMLYPEFTDELKAAMMTETRDFVSSVVFDGDGRLETVLTAPYSFINPSLAKLYGMTSTGATPQKTNLDPTQRSGLLTQAGFLTVTGATNGSNPVKRGRKVLERLLCGTLPPPPPNVPPPKAASAGGTTRERFAEHSQNACALGCHTLMDPIGFGFENYDGIGRYRTTDNGKPVDAASQLTLDGTSQSFKNAVELTKLLSNSNDAHSCFVKQWTRFALSRAETDADQASINAATSFFTKGNGSVRELLVGVALSRTFRYRSLAVGEMP